VSAGQSYIAHLLLHVSIDSDELKITLTRGMAVFPPGVAAVHSELHSTQVAQHLGDVGHPSPGSNRLYMNAPHKGDYSSSAAKHA
jgi:hypothetical protein